MLANLHTPHTIIGLVRFIVVGVVVVNAHIQRHIRYIGVGRRGSVVVVIIIVVVVAAVVVVSNGA